MALNIMSNLENEIIINSILNEDAKIFNSISGVGSKLALRIINELKEKFKKKLLKKEITISKDNNSIFQDLVSCLVNLGFSQKICETTASYVIKVKIKKKTQELIPIAIKKFIKS